MTTFLLMAGLFVGSLVLQALFLWLGAHWVRASRAYFWQAALAQLIMCVVNAVLMAATVWGPSLLTGQDTLALVLQWVCLIGELLLSWLVIRSVFGTTFLRAMLVWLVGLIGVISALGFVFLIVKPYVLEAFVIPTNGMAPTVIGWHKVSECPRCQGVLIVPTAEPGEPERFLLGGGHLGICLSCLKTSSVQFTDPAIRIPDRIVTNKLLKPHRWDMIVFRYPRDPSVKYMMRLIGLPGESVFIDEGAIWIDDVKLEPPPELAGLSHTTEVEGGTPVATGTPENPCRLGQDEYCVLGDFSQLSSDSRFWGPLPGANIEGVVTVSYWPLSRWKVFR
jgi:signal peptidase I